MSIIPRFSGRPGQARFVEMHKRMWCELAGFLNSPAQTLAAYKESDTSVAARYARGGGVFPHPQHREGTAGHRWPDRPKEPRPPISTSHRTDVVREPQGRPTAVAPYDEAVRLQLTRPSCAPARAGADPNRRPGADKLPSQFERGVRIEPDTANGWHFLGVAYAAKNDIRHGGLLRCEGSVERGAQQLAVPAGDARHQILKVGRRRGCAPRILSGWPPKRR